MLKDNTNPLHISQHVSLQFRISGCLHLFPVSGPVYTLLEGHTNKAVLNLKIASLYFYWILPLK